MSRTGAFAKVGRVELRDGVIVRMSPIHVPHARARMHITQALLESVRRTMPELEVTDEVTIRFGGGFQPTADIVIWAPEGDVAALDGPVPGVTVKLVVEVSDATIGDDLGDKLAAYARAGVPEYWVVDVKARVIFQHAAPGPEGYGERKTLRFGEQAASLTLPDIDVETAALAG